MSKQVVQKVTFPFPLKGEYLIELVEQMVKESPADLSARFHKEQHFATGLVCRIGQWSASPHNHLIVAATATARGIRPEDRYNDVVVMHHSWGGVVEVSDQNAVVLQNRAARQLAEKLQAYYADPIDDSAVWPQELEICDSCSRQVKWVNDQPYCPKHKEAVLLRTVKVMPAPEQ